MSTKRKTPRRQPAAFYLGDKYQKFYREAKLRELAQQFDLENPSQLLQDIADGKIKLIKSHEKQPA